MKKMVQIAFGVVGTVALIIAAWKFLSLDVLLDAMANLRIVPLFAALFMYILVTSARAYRFMILEEKLSFVEAFSASSVHNALLRVMPLRSGELAYGIMLKRMGKGGFGQGVAAVLMLRLVDLGMIAGLTAVLAGSHVTGSGHIGTIMLVLFFLLGVGFLFFVSRPVVRLLQTRILSKHTEEKRPLWVRAVEAVRDVLNLSLKRRLQLTLTTVLLWGLVLFWFYFIMLGAGLELSLQSGFTAGILGVVGSMLPLSLVGSFGPQEGGFALGLCAVGHNPNTAAAAAVIISSFTFLHNWIVALPSWGWVLFRTRR